ncbi:uncharacterized protein FOMMEDRAFT_130934 [Fomitiporia mediterranea MF3/22]|uniref:uncharacterized protein n=1 Tax=Fomitiporia mediterranea (strain MF3/22) TaxID=694068 RepID=UPI0004409920|nr:uncharacterized protein FOMMEDRAFT_130934 [Fomitiporia mediterranea MF3/22]EJD07891.1 hypothetical protein FOMMEDRAFT_130934 [Fomitiporia mediterranea MF3/22]
MSLAKLTSLSTQTLSLLLERQRLQTMNQPAPAASTQNIIRNLAQLRSGILALEVKTQDGNGGKAEKEASALLRSQFARMRDMLGSDVAGIDPLPPLVKESEIASELSPIPPPPPRKDTTYVPYSDEPPPSPENDASPPELLEQQRLLMEEQDAHLDHLSLSVTRQRDISLQINDELTVHNGLLDELGHDVDNTHGRLNRARKRLDRFSRGVKGNLSTYIIAGIILILLILIIIFKT